MVGSFNLISVYFAVLFVGIGVDFAHPVQRALSRRTPRDRRSRARRSAAPGFHVAAPLTLAGCATAAGFFSFLPTDYKGVSELGLIAGFGMLIAFATSVTVLPALISLLNPPGEPEPLGYAVAGAGRRFPRAPSHRRSSSASPRSCSAACRCSIWLRFDFNPINLRDPEDRIRSRPISNSPRSVDRRQRDRGAGAQSRSSANAIAATHVETAGGFARGHAVQLHSRGAERRSCRSSPTAGKRLERRLRSEERAETPPTDAENVDALNEGAARLTEAAGDQPGAGADAAQAAGGSLTALAEGDAPRARQGAARYSSAAASADLEATCSAACRPSQITQAVAAARSGARLDDGRRTRARLDRAQGRPRRQRRDAPLRRAPCSRSSPTQPKGRSRFWRPARRSSGAFIEAGHLGAGRRSRFCCGWCCGGSATCC